MVDFPDALTPKFSAPGRAHFTRIDDAADSRPGRDDPDDTAGSEAGRDPTAERRAEEPAKKGK